MAPNSYSVVVVLFIVWVSFDLWYTKEGLKLKSFNYASIVAKESNNLISEENLGLINRTQINRPLVVIYHRIPKTGSSSLTNMIGEHISRSKNIHVHYTKFDNELLHTESYSSDPVVLCSYLESLRHNLTSEDQGLYYHGHFNYTDCFHGYNWFSVVRDPVQRAISHYRYMHDTLPKEMVAGFKTKLLSMSLEQYIQKPLLESAQSLFCGYESVCSSGSSVVLQKAKANIEEKYFLVGLTEEYDKNIALLEAYLPEVFQGFGSKKIAHINKSTITKSTANITNTVLSQLRNALAQEIELYEFIKKRFHNQLTLNNIPL